MLTSIHIQGFKGFTDTAIGPLRKVNLIVGGQNVGKTSLLEAVYLTLAVTTGSPFRPNEGNDQGRFAKNALGKNFQAIEVRSFDGDVQRVGVNLSSDFLVFTGTNNVSFGRQGLNQIPVPAPIPLFLPHQGQLVQLFGEVVLARKKRELTKLLQLIEPRLLSLDAVSPDGEQRIYAEIEGIAQALPLPELGHGFARLLYLFCTLLSTEAKLALIDEVESGIHYSALPTLLQGIKNVAQVRDVQTLMTTHSWDCIRAACEVFADSPEDFQVIRLERTEGNIRAVCIDGERMQRLMADDREVR
jgi:AAA15 family ATPase/GTPase